MKCMVLADVHQSAVKWRLLVETVREQKPDLVAIAGDLLPKDEGILAQLSYIPALKEYASAIRTAGAELILIAGNDDNQLVVPELEKGDREGLWHYAADRVREVGGYQFCGCPWIRDYPFVYKYWVAAETGDNPCIDDFQMGPPVIINRHNELEEIPDLEAYLKSKPSIDASLEDMFGQLKDPARSIWLIHQPPVDMGFDLCGSGARAGSSAVYDFLLRRQPLLSVHGHIHEAPLVNGNIWAKNLGRTLCIQAGQPDGEIFYAAFELLDGGIENLRHSVYGSYTTAWEEEQDV